MKMMLRRSLQGWTGPTCCSWPLQQHLDLAGTREGRVLPSPLVPSLWPVVCELISLSFEKHICFPSGEHWIWCALPYSVALMCFTWGEGRKKHGNQLMVQRAAADYWQIINFHCHMCTSLRVVAFLLWRFCKSDFVHWSILQLLWKVKTMASNSCCSKFLLPRRCG